MIPEATLREIQDRLSIVEVVGGYVSLRKAGRVFKALCPFHAEKTASFVVYPEKQFFICYGCGAGGDAFTFVMKQERLEFSEAAELLAEKAGVEIAQGGGRAGGRKQSQELFQAQEIAAAFFQDQLKNAPEAEAARTYLEKRGLNPAAWDVFRLGYAPSRWDGLLQHAGKAGLTPQVLEKGGLVMARGGGEGWYDRFRDRVMFPVSDVRGRVIAFTGRVFREGDDGPKYMNSPETDLYVKGRVLYGLNLAAPAIREKDFCIVVEGNLDMIMPYLHGIHNVVAPMGTSLTEAQIKLLQRYTRNVVIVYDGDAAGEAATLRGLDLCLEAEMRVKIAALPAGMDPDSLIRKQGVEAFAGVLQKSRDLFDYRIELLLRQYDPKEMEGRIRICQDLLPTLKRVPNAIQRGEYVRRLAEILGLDERVLWTELERVRLDRSPVQAGRAAAAPEPVRTSAMSPEELLAGLLLEDPERAVQLQGQLDPEDLQDSQVRQLVGWMIERADHPETPGDSRAFLSSLSESSGEWESRIARWLAWADSMQEKERTFSDVVEKIHALKRQAEMEKIRSSIRQAEESGDHETALRLTSEFQRMQGRAVAR